MIAAWYAIASFVLITYVVLDGRNWGAGMLHWLVARTPAERGQVQTQYVPPVIKILTEALLLYLVFEAAVGRRYELDVRPRVAFRSQRLELLLL